MTQYFSFIGLLGIAVSLAGCPSSDIVVCDPVDCISEQQFSNNIVSSLQTSPGVAGYVVYVGGLPPVYAGYAVLSDNPPSLSILPSNLANIESISKMLTTFAVLQSLKNNNISLDSPIYPYLYSDWQSLAGVGIAPNLLGPQVTFRDFLTHRSGWAADNNGGGCGGPSTSYAILKAKIQLSTIPQAQGSNAAAGQYSNCNFAIFRELLPQMEGTSINSITDDNKRALASAQFYNEYVNTNVRIAAGIPGMWSCTPVSDPSTAINYQILSYPTPNGPGLTPPYVPPLSAIPSANWGDYFLLCGAGGWNLSASDIVLLFNSLGQVLTPDLQAELFNRSSPNFPGLGWDNTVGNCPGSNTSGKTYYWCKNGGEGYPPACGAGQTCAPCPGCGIETFVGLFKCNAVTVVVFVNSPLPQNITTLVTTAFNNKTTQASGNPQPCVTSNVGG
jgi:hypothetical protein